MKARSVGRGFGERWTDRAFGASPARGRTDFELGYRLAREYWGQGFATECGRAWVEAAFTSFGLERVVAFAHPENAASIRVMTKVGMMFERCGRFYGMESVLYSMRRGT